QGIRRCNNYVVLQSIPCSPECKIVSQILLDHPLSYALTATIDILAVYLQQFWKTVHKVPNTKDTIRFKLDTQEITYTVDMFRDTLKLPVETPDNPFITSVTIRTMESLMQTKDVIQYPRFTKLIIADLMKKYLSIPQRHDDNYHSIKDDTLLKEYETVFIGVYVLMNQPQLVVSTQRTHRTIPRAHKTPTLNDASPQGKKRKQGAGETSSPRKSLKVTIGQKKQSIPSLPPPVQEKLDEEEISNMVEGEEDEESYASEFANSMLNDDVDDSGTRIELEIHKETQEVVTDDDVSKKKDNE
ncbi:hypothetical protein Tco_1573916, partial [Tanacetum coccineum]